MRVPYQPRTAVTKEAAAGLLRCRWGAGARSEASGARYEASGARFDADGRVRYFF